MVDLPAAAAVAGFRRGGEADAGAGAVTGAAADAATTTTLRIDPDAGEAGRADFTLSATLLPRQGLLTRTAHCGEVPADAFLAALGLAMDGCVAVFDAMKAALLAAARRQARGAARAAGAGGGDAAAPA
jgi:hypothetical protein